MVSMYRAGPGEATESVWASDTSLVWAAAAGTEVGVPELGLGPLVLANEVTLSVAVVASVPSERCGSVDVTCIVGRSNLG